MYGTWTLLEAVFGMHQINVPHRGAWNSFMKKGTKTEVAPDYFHHLGDDEWERLTVLHAPVKMMKEAGQEACSRKGKG